MRKSRKKRKLKAFILIFFAGIVIFTVVFADKKMTPLINTLALTKAQNLTTLIINNTISDMLSEDNNSFTDLMKIDYDENGKISALSADSIKVNRLKSMISVSITDAIGQIEESHISIALGTLTGNAFLLGRGPEIDLNVHISCSCSIEVRNTFEYSGINQTMHKAFLDITANVYVLAVGENLSSQVFTSIPIAETVIIGQIPEIYAGKDDSLWQDLIN